MTTFRTLETAQVGAMTIDPNSVLISTRQGHCDHGNCTDAVTHVVMVTSSAPGIGNGVVEVRLACPNHVTRVHAGWANKSTAILRVA